MLASGFNVSVALLVLLKLLPETDTRYAVGEEGANEAGGINPTRRTVPANTCRLVAVTVADGPVPLEGSSFTLIPAAESPDGKPEPVKYTIVMPGCAVLGLGVVDRFTWANIIALAIRSAKSIKIDRSILLRSQIICSPPQRFSLTCPLVLPTGGRAVSGLVAISPFTRSNSPCTTFSKSASG